MKNKVVKEILFRMQEWLSLFSCSLNVLIGTGDREITLSAGSWELKRRDLWIGKMYVFLIDGFWKLFGQQNHCESAWTDHAEIWPKVREERGVVE